MCNVWAPEVPAIPPLNPDDLPQLDKSAFSTSTSSQAASTDSNIGHRTIPKWVTDSQAVRAADVKPSNDSSWVTGHLPPLPLVEFRSSSLVARVVGLLALVAVGASAISVGFAQLPAAAAFDISLLTILIFFVSTNILFRKTPEWRAKHDKVLIFKRCRAETSKITREMKKLDAGRHRIDTNEQRIVSNIDSRADKARGAEQKELADARSRLASRVQQLQKQRSSLQSSEDREAGNALRLLQDQHISSYLRRASIQAAIIPGIGPGIARSLAASGVITAADFSGASYSGGQVMIKLRNGYYVHPKGVGEKKAQALDSWRRTLEMQARATQPPRLPSSQAQVIKAKYAQQRQTLANEEQAAHAHASVELNRISQKWMQTHASISAELIAARQDFAQERAQVDAEIIAIQKQANATAWQRDLAIREITAHRKINYLRYLIINH
jgi:hypothetical protein